MQKGDVVCSKYSQNKTTHRAQLNSKVNKFSLKIDLILIQIINDLCLSSKTLPKVSSLKKILKTVKENFIFLLSKVHNQKKKFNIWFICEASGSLIQKEMEGS